MRSAWPRRYRANLAFSPEGDRLAYVSDETGAFAVMILPLGPGRPRQLQLPLHSVGTLVWGDRLYLMGARTGDEWNQIYSLNPESGDLSPFAAVPGAQLHLQPQALSPDGRRLAYVVAHGQEQVAVARDLKTGAERELFRAVEGLSIQNWSPCGRYVALAVPDGNAAIDLAVHDIACDSAFLLKGGPGVSLRAGPWNADGASLLLLGDCGEFQSLWRYFLADGSVTPIACPEGADVEFVCGPHQGEWFCFGVNQRGMQEIRRWAAGGKPLPLPSLPVGIMTAPTVAPDGTAVAFLFRGPAHPACLGLIDLTAHTVRWFGDPPVDAVMPERHGVAAPDGALLDLYLYTPRTEPPSGGWPVVIMLHGGPEGQFRPVFEPRIQRLLAAGFAVAVPNLRGSRGYGRTFQLQIRRQWGGPDWSDLQAIANWLRSDSRLSPDRHGLLGESYGGYLALWAATQAPYRWGAVVSIQGPVDLLDLVRSQRADWRQLAEAQIGHPERDAGRLTERSPLTCADRITAPVMVVHGREDIRVPVGQVERLIAALRGRGHPVTALLLDGHGHDISAVDALSQVDDLLLHFLMQHLGLDQQAEG